MLRLLMLIIVLAVILVVVGLFRGWFHVSSGSTDENPSVTVTVDKARMEEDKELAKEKAEALREQVRGKATSQPATPAGSEGPERP